VFVPLKSDSKFYVVDMQSMKRKSDGAVVASSGFGRTIVDSGKWRAGLRIESGFKNRKWV
jgi:hypothetical protein